MVGKNRVWELRMSKGWSTRYLAKLSGLSRSSITRIENESISPTFDTMIKISKAFNMNIWDVFYY